ncbi:16021_t:CDS:2, partial [Dentiscutata erythropus]
VKISRSNHSIFVWNTAQLSILSNYKLIEEAYQDHNPVYIKLQVPKITADINEQSLVPLIPGYFIFMFFGGVYCFVKLEKRFYQEEKEITHLINLGKRVANSNNYDQSFKKRATQLKNEN